MAARAFARCRLTRAKLVGIPRAVLDARPAGRGAAAHRQGERSRDLGGRRDGLHPGLPGRRQGEAEARGPQEGRPGPLGPRGRRRVHRAQGRGEQEPALARRGARPVVYHGHAAERRHAAPRGAVAARWHRDGRRRYARASGPRRGAGPRVLRPRLRGGPRRFRTRLPEAAPREGRSAAKGERVLCHRRGAGKRVVAGGRRPVFGGGGAGFQGADY